MTCVASRPQTEQVALTLNDCNSHVYASSFRSRELRFSASNSAAPTCPEPASANPAHVLVRSPTPNDSPPGVRVSSTAIGHGRTNPPRGKATKRADSSRALAQRVTASPGARRTPPPRHRAFAELPPRHRAARRSPRARRAHSRRSELIRCALNTAAAPSSTCRGRGGLAPWSVLLPERQLLPAPSSIVRPS